jgi:Tfp pilus assembly protein PilF
MKTQALMMSLIAILALLLGGVSFERNRVWTEDISLWLDAAIKSPNKRSTEHAAFIYYGLGQDYAASGRPDDALAMFRRAITIKPDYAKPYFEIGLVYQRQGILDKASEAFASAVAIDPNHEDAWISIGTIAAQQGRFDDAARSFRQAIAINGQSDIAYHNLGSAEFKKGDYQQAITHYSAAIKCNPSSGATYYDRALAFQAAGKPDREVRDLQRSCALKYENACAALQRSEGSRR